MEKIIGIDEVGRGCVAGPIVCASFTLDCKTLLNICRVAKEVYSKETKERRKKALERLAKLTYYDYKQVQNSNYKIQNEEIKTSSKIYENISSNLDILSLVFDSKKVTEKNRKIATEFLLNFGNFGIGVVSNSIIDNRGIQFSNKLAMLKSLSPHFSIYYILNSKYYVLTDHLDPRGIDYNIEKNFDFFTSDKMDSKSFVTACASIIAKVYRDTLMEIYHNKFPHYGFINNVGYGTPLHIQKIKELGICPIHRKTFLNNYIQI